MNGLTPISKVSTQLPSKIQAGNSVGGTTAARPGPASGTDDQLRGLCREFEAFFLNELLKQSGIFGNGGHAWDVSGQDSQGGSGAAGGNAYADMTTQSLADEVAKMGGLGLGDILFDYLKDKGTGVQ